MQDEQSGRGAHVIGPLTYTNLADLSVFFRDAQPDAFGTARVPFSPPLARMSAELAANVYDLNVAPWIRSGFTDCTFVIEDRVVPLDRDSDSKLAAIEAEWKRRRARSLIRGVRPIGDLVRAARQFFVTDMNKSVVMARVAPDGQVVIAISFIGTTQKFFDWFSNFKMHPEVGMHYGFLELARQFDAQAPRVLLPALAAASGRDTYTLADAMLEAKRPGSRITFWISGHSQGGALVQTYTHLLIGRGIDPSRIHAYSFAAPTVSAAGGGFDPKGYPIYNIVNLDDSVPRVGSQIRLGVDCLYAPDDAFRDAHYRVDDTLRPAFDRMLYIGDEVRSTTEAVCWGIAVMRMLRQIESDDDAAAFFAEIVPHLSTFRRMGLELDGIAQYVQGKLEDQLRGMTGMPPDVALIGRYEDMMRVAAAEFTPKLAAHAMTRRLWAPHRIGPDKKDEDFVPPYIAIVRRYLNDLEQGVWLSDPPPRCVNAGGEVILPLYPPLGLPPEGAFPALPEGVSGQATGGEDAPATDETGGANNMSKMENIGNAQKKMT